VKIDPVVLVENRLTDGNCCAHSRHRSTASNTSCYSYCKVHVHDIMCPTCDHLTYVPLAHLACLIYQGTLPFQPNNVEWNEKVMKVDWYHAHFLHVHQVATPVLLYLLGGDTMVQSGLYARLCHTVVVLHINQTRCGVMRVRWHATTASAWAHHPFKARNLPTSALGHPNFALAMSFHAENKLWSTYSNG